MGASEGRQQKSCDQKFPSCLWHSMIPFCVYACIALCRRLVFFQAAQIRVFWYGRRVMVLLFSDRLFHLSASCIGLCIRAFILVSSYPHILISNAILLFPRISKRPSLCNATLPIFLTSHTHTGKSLCALSSAPALSPATLNARARYGPTTGILYAKPAIVLKNSPKRMNMP